MTDGCPQSANRQFRLPTTPRMGQMGANSAPQLMTFNFASRHSRYDCPMGKLPDFRRIFDPSMFLMRVALTMATLE